MADDKVELRDINFRQVFAWTELFRSFQVALDPKKLLLAAAGIVLMALGWQALKVPFYGAKPEKADFPVANYADEQEADQAFKTAERNWKQLDRAAGGQGELGAWPWEEQRGKYNQLKMVTGQTQRPWQPGEFGEWLLTDQFLVLIEPIRKFLYPIVYLLHPETGGWNRLYFLLVTLWTLAVWALFGGAITRMAAVQVARNERVGLMEALRFVWSRYTSYLSAPIFPLLFVVFMVVALVVFGLFFMIPILGDIVIAGVFYPLVFLAGIAMAVVLVGLVGWPMMYATISTEGSDSFDAISRSYSYVYQSPWSFIWYALVACAYGAVVVFFVGFMGSLVVYLGKWGISATPFIAAANREPYFLYVHAPESFGWRALLLEGGPARDTILESMTWYNHVGAVLVGAWLYLAFLMVLGFGYSFFWSASTIIYLLMRRKVDDTDLDEVYLEEEDDDFGFAPPAAPASPPTSSAITPGLTMVEAPTLRPSTPAADSSGAKSEMPVSSEAKAEMPASDAGESGGDKPSGDGASS